MIAEKFYRVPDDVELCDRPWLYAEDVTDYVEHLMLLLARAKRHIDPHVGNNAKRDDAEKIRREINEALS